MKDKLGKYLLDWRIRTVIPNIRGRLLDIGCGTNQLVNSYSGEGIGVDIYPWEGVDLVVENTAALPYKDNDFDTVTIIASLNHIPNREEVLLEANRVLKTDGQIIITMIPPVISSIWHKVREKWDVDQSERGMIEGEVFGLSENEINRLLNNAGFQVIDKKRFMLYVNLLTIGKKTRI